VSKLKKIKKWIVTDTINGLLLYTPKNLKQKGPDFLALLALGMVSLVWGTTWVVSRQGVLHMPALQLSGIRQIIGGSCYLLFFIFKKYPLPSRSDFIPLIILSILNFVMSNGLSTWGVKYISAGLASIIGAIFPLWIVLIGYALGTTNPPKKAIAGVLIGFSGICVIFYDHLSDFINPDFRFGIFLSLIATFSWAFGTLYTKKHAKVFNPYFGLGFQMVLAGIILTTISSFDPAFMTLSEIPAISWFAIFYLVIFGSLVGFTCYLYALQHLPTEQTSIYAYINPLVALIAGWIVLGEGISFSILLGCLITLFGIYLVNSSFNSK
jgi:drug/metabolite transporter (DMT)-like permease